MTILTNYEMNSKKQIRGTVVNDSTGRFATGHVIDTTPVVKINAALQMVMTESGSIYVLVGLSHSGKDFEAFFEDRKQA